MTTKKGTQYGKDSTPNPSVSKYARLAEPAGAGAVEWEEVDGRLIKAAIQAATADGCALIFGKTSDGGALSFTLLGPGAPVKRWFKSFELAESFLRELVAAADA